LGAKTARSTEAAFTGGRKGHSVKIRQRIGLPSSNVSSAQTFSWKIRVTARRIAVLNPTHGYLDAVLVPNTDGFDPDSTSDVLLEDSFFHGNDDAIAIKAGWDCAGYQLGVPSNNITIRNITSFHGGGGISIGSEMSGGVSNVDISDVKLIGGSYGIYLKTGSTRGGYIENVTVTGVTMTGILKKSISIDAFYGSPNPYCGSPAPIKPSVVKRVLIQNVITTGGNESLHLAGLQMAPTTEIGLVNVTMMDDSFVDCPGFVHGWFKNVTPVPPPACGLQARWVG